MSVDNDEKHRRIDGKTPSGGDYSEITFYDDQGNNVSKLKATHAIICEYKSDGTLLTTHHMVKDSKLR